MCDTPNLPTLPICWHHHCEGTEASAWKKPLTEAARVRACSWLPALACLRICIGVPSEAESVRPCPWIHEHVLHLYRGSSPTAVTIIPSYTLCCSLPCELNVDLVHCCNSWTTLYQRTSNKLLIYLLKLFSSVTLEASSANGFSLEMEHHQ